MHRLFCIFFIISFVVLLKCLYLSLQVLLFVHPPPSPTAGGKQVSSGRVKPRQCTCYPEPTLPFCNLLFLQPKLTDHQITPNLPFQTAHRCQNEGKEQSVAQKPLTALLFIIPVEAFTQTIELIFHNSDSPYPQLMPPPTPFLFPQKLSKQSYLLQG